MEITDSWENGPGLKKDYLSQNKCEGTKELDCLTIISMWTEASNSLKLQFIYSSHFGSKTSEIYLTIDIKHKIFFNFAKTEQKNNIETCTFAVFHMVNNFQYQYSFPNHIYILLLYDL